jgi:beta-lactamase class A
MFKMILRFAAAFIAFVTLTAAQSSKLDQSIKDRVTGFKGEVSVYAKNLRTGKTYSLLGDRPVRTASTIKLAIMVECFAEAAAGKLDLHEPLELIAEDKVNGSGILKDLTTGDKLPLLDVMDLMIVLSDNTATNLILSRIGGDNVNARMQQLGLIHTRVMRKVLNEAGKPRGVTREGMKPENQKYGLGRASTKEMVTLLEKIYRGELIDKSSSEQMLAALKRQRDHDGLARDMKDITVANKTGALDHLRSDVGIMYVPSGPIAVAITVDEMPEVNWSPDNPGLLLISQLSEILAAQL